jgi:small subunit ribosomal protein S9
MVEVKKKTKKKPKKIKKAVEKIKKPALKPAKFFEAVGRRKTAVARIRLFTAGEKSVSINKKPLENYFPPSGLQKIVLSPLEIMKCLDKFRISVIVKGGGVVAQAEAIRHGLARALTILNPNFRKRLKKAGFLKRDPRMKERKKFGLKRARRAPQWQKR